MADAAVADAPAPSAGTKPPLRKVTVGPSSVDSLIPEQLRQSQEASARESAALEAETKARKDLEPKLQAEYAKQDALKVPDAPTYEQAPEHQEIKVRPPYEALGQFLPMLAVIGSGFARKSARGALKAAIGAMQGQQKGDQDAQERNDKDFEEKLKEISAHNEILKDWFQGAMDGYKVSHEEGDRRIATLLRSMDMPHQEVLMAQGQRALVVDALKTTIGVSDHMHTLQHQAVEEGLERQRIGVEMARTRAEQAHWQAEQTQNLQRLEMEGQKQKITGIRAMQAALKPTAKDSQAYMSLKTIVDRARDTLKSGSGVGGFLGGKNIDAAQQAGLIEMLSKIQTGGVARAWQGKLLHDYQSWADRVQSTPQSLYGRGGPLSRHQVEDILNQTDALLRDKKDEINSAIEQQTIAAPNYGLEDAKEYLPPEMASYYNQVYSPMELPTHPSASNLTRGQLYQTSKGPAYWRGDHFEATE